MFSVPMVWNSRFEKILTDYCRREDDEMMTQQPRLIAHGFEVMIDGADGSSTRSHWLSSCRSDYCEIPCEKCDLLMKASW